MIIRFLKEEGIKNDIKQLEKLTKQKYPELYIDLFNNYVEEEEDIFIREKELFYPLCVKLNKDTYYSVLFLSYKNIEETCESTIGSLMNSYTLVPFASIGTNVYYCFNFSKRKIPTIVLYDMNKSKFDNEITEEDLKIESKEKWENLGVTFLFESFEEFLNNFAFNPRDVEEEEYKTVDDFYDIYDNWKDYFYVSKR